MYQVLRVGIDRLFCSSISGNYVWRKSSQHLPLYHQNQKILWYFPITWQYLSAFQGHTCSMSSLAAGKLPGFRHIAVSPCLGAPWDEANPSENWQSNQGIAHAILQLVAVKISMITITIYDLLCSIFCNDMCYQSIFDDFTFM